MEGVAAYYKDLAQERTQIKRAKEDIRRERPEKAVLVRRLTVQWLLNKHLEVIHRQVKCK